ncbi:hypothetical protein ACFL01_05120 [Planctomycetota bacterium]
MSVDETHTESLFSFQAGGECYRIQIANTRELREKAFRLMYDIYEDIEYGHTHPTRMWYSLYELLPDSVTVMVLHGEEAVATVTVVNDSPFALPDDVNYSEEMDRERANGRKLSQIISLGVRTDVRGAGMVLVRMFNFAYFVARGISGATDFINTVIPRHAPFYYKKLLFEPMGEVRYQPKTGVEVALIKLDFDEAEHEAHAEHGLFGAGAETRHTLYKQFNSVQERPDIVEALRNEIRPVTEEDLVYFLGKKPELWRKTPSDQRVYFELLTEWSRQAHREVHAA